MSGLQVAGASARQLQTGQRGVPRLWRGVDSVRDLEAPAVAPTRAQDSASPESKPANAVSTDSAPGKDATASACEPYRDFIELSLSKGRNAKAIYQDLADDHGFTGRYASVKRFPCAAAAEYKPSKHVP